jgi:hypothetical protein
MREIAETAYCLQLPKRTENNHLIFIMRVGHYNSACYSLDDVTKYAFAVTDILNSQPAAQLNGFIIILDMSEVNLQHVTLFTADFARRYIDCWEKMYPACLHQIHFYNYPTLFDPVYSIFRMFYYRDMRERIFFHSKSSNECRETNPLHDYIDPALLPRDYSGQLDSIDGAMNQTFVQWTREHNNSLIELDRYSIDLTQVSQLLDDVRHHNHTHEQ